MPVQDNDDKRTADQPVVDAEEEIRRKQAQVQEQQQEESGAQKSGKLLPFLTLLTRKSPIRRTRSTATRRRSKP